MSKVPAADHTMRILTLLARSQGPLPASMIASRLDLPRSTVYHLLAVMEQRGFVMRIEEERRYGLGIAALELSAAYARQEPLARVGRTAVAALVDQVGVSGHLSVLQGRDVMYVVEERAPRALFLVTDVNVRLPAHLTASGRAMLARLPAAQLRALYPSVSALGSTRTAVEPIRTYSELRSVLRQTAARGYATENGDVTEGFASVAVAVLDHRSWPVAGLALTFREEDFDDAAQAELAAEVAKTAAEISRRIYGRVPGAASAGGTNAGASRRGTFPERL